MKVIDHIRIILLFAFVRISLFDAQAGEPELKGLLVEQAEIKAELETLPRLIPSAQVHGQLGFYGARAASQRIILDLGKEIEPDEIILFPGKLPVDSDQAEDIGFPPEVEVEISSDASFSETIRIGRWEEESPMEGARLAFLRFPVPKEVGITGRFLQLRIFGSMPGAEHRGRAFAFSEIIVMENGRNAALGRTVRNRGGFENAPRWTAQNLTDGYLCYLPGIGILESETNGFHSAIEASPDHVKWVEVDLGEAPLIDEIHLIPAHPPNFAHMAGFGFPKKFRILGYDQDGEEEVLFDFSSGGFPNPGACAVMFPLEQREFRRIRIEANELWERNNDYLFALAELQVWSGGENVAYGKPVSALDEVGIGLWSNPALTDGFSSQRNLLPLQDWIDGLTRHIVLERRSAEIAQSLDQNAVRARQRWFAFAVVVSLVGTVGFVLVIWIQRRQAARAHEALRQRLAHDLHDELGASISHLALQSDLARRELPDESPVNARLSKLSISARATIDEMRDVIWLLAPETDSWQSFLDRLESISRRLLDGIEYDIQIEGEVPQGKPGIGWVRECVLIYKEALTNILKHAEAEQVMVKLAWDASNLCMDISDDGRGFDLEDPSAGRGMGLQNYRRRVVRLGGNLDIQSSPAEGTHLSFGFPLERSQA